MKDIHSNIHSNIKDIHSNIFMVLNDNENIWQFFIPSKIEGSCPIKCLGLFGGSSPCQTFNHIVKRKQIFDKTEALLGDKQTP